MISSDPRKKDFTTLPYDKSAPITLIIHKESAIADDQNTITLVTAPDGDEDPGTFVFGLYPLTFDANKQFSLTYGNSPAQGLDACQVEVVSDTVTVSYPDTVTTPQEIGVGLNLWWASGVSRIGIVGSPELYAAVSFNGSTKVLKDGNLIYFYAPS